MKREKEEKITTKESCNKKEENEKTRKIVGDGRQRRSGLVLTFMYIMLLLLRKKK